MRASEVLFMNRFASILFHMRTCQLNHFDLVAHQDFKMSANHYGDFKLTNLIALR